MRSNNHLSLSGVVTKIEPDPERSGVKFYLVHNFGGGNPPLFLPCVLKRANCSIENGETLRIDGHLRAVNGKPTAFVTKAFSV